MKNYFTVCLTMTLLNFGVNAQDGQFLDDGTETTLMVLDKESNLPICRLSDQVRINSEFIPENRIGDVEMTSIEDIRICQEDDVWDAVEEEMLVGVAVGIPSLAFPVKSLMTIGGLTGCLLEFILKWDKAKGVPEINISRRLIGNGVAGGANGLSLIMIYHLIKEGVLPNFRFSMRGIGVGALSSLAVAEICRRL